MDDIRAQLDALMGQDRNVPLSERDKYKNERKFSDPDICKYYLCGFCPHEEFRRTKNDCGDCPSVHDEGCRKQWEELDDRSKERYGYEADLLKWFDRLLSDLRKRIDANTARLAGPSALEPLVLVDDQQRLDNLTQQINDLLARAAELGEAGEVDAAQAAAADAERLKVQRGVFEQQAQARAASRAGKTSLHQQVCPISGLIINNEESRLQDHYSGRNYNSWKKLHEVHAQLLEAQQKRRSAGVSSSSRDYRNSRDERESSKRYDDRDRDRDRRRYDERDRDGRRYDDRDRRYDDRDRRDSRRYDDRDRRDGRRYDDRDRDSRREYRRRSRSRERQRERERVANSPPPRAAEPAAT